MRPPDRVERRAGQRQHAREILRERLRGPPALPVPRSGVDAAAAGREPRVELVQRVRHGDRDEEVAAQEAHGVLHRPLLVPGVGVAVAALAAVVRPELGEEPRLRDLAERHPAGLGGVVEHEQARRAPDPLEDRPQAPAEDLGPLARQGDAEAGVGVRQRHHQELQVDRASRDRRPEVPEVDLRRARRPLELEVPVPRPLRVLAPPGGHVPPDRRVRALVAHLVRGPVVDPLGRVPLLARHRQVRLQDRVDPAREAVRGRAGPPPDQRGLGRHVPHVRVLGDGVPADPQLAGDPRPRHPVPVHPPDILLFV